jgi:isopenicillin-N epimerase
MRNLFLLDSNVIFFNHGSSGTCPKPVFDEYQRWQLELERQPVGFLRRRFNDLMCEARSALGDFLGAEAPDRVS